MKEQLLRDWRDDCGRFLRAPRSPQRIISLCPSLTETLFSLGLAGRIAGRTRYCIHPQAGIDAVPTVGGTKQLDFSAIQQLNPDLILAEKEENRREDVEALSQQGWPVYVMNIESVQQALQSLTRLGALLNCSVAAEQMQEQVQSAFAALRPLAPPQRVLYLIWRKPWMAVGASTYIDSILQHCGLHNVAKQFDGRYPQICDADMGKLSVDLCLLSSEPYPFKEFHLAEIRSRLPQARVELVDGEMFSWYGSRMLPAAEYLQQQIRHWSGVET